MNSLRTLPLFAILLLLLVPAGPSPASPALASRPAPRSQAGDVNGDGRVDLQDVALALRIAGGLLKPSAAAFSRADVWPNPGNRASGIGDGRVTADDARRILQYVLGILSPFDLAPPPPVTTLAGLTHPEDLQKLDFDVSASPFAQPWTVIADPRGGVFVADYGQGRVYRIAPDGRTSVVAGEGIPGYRDGPAQASRFKFPIGLAADAQGDVFVADAGNHCIRRIDAGGQVATVAGSVQRGFADGQGAAARFQSPNGVALDGAGNLYVADTGNHAIRKIDPSGTVTTIAGPRPGALPAAPHGGLRDGPAAQALFRDPTDVAFGPDGALYVADCYNHRIRKIDSNGWVSTLAGAGAAGPDGLPQGGYQDGPAAKAQFDHPFALGVDTDGNVFVADWYNQRIRVITPGGRVRTVAGADGQVVLDGRPGGWLDGLGNVAQFLSPMGVAVAPDGSLYVADSDNRSVRLIRRTW